jgi:hypothetical protein
MLQDASLPSAGQRFEVGSSNAWLASKTNSRPRGPCTGSNSSAASTSKAAQSASSATAAEPVLKRRPAASGATRRMARQPMKRRS